MYDCVYTFTFIVSGMDLYKDNEIVFNSAGLHAHLASKLDLEKLTIIYLIAIL